MSRNNFIFSAVIFLFALSSCSNKFDGKDGIKTVYFPNTEKIQQVVEFKDGKRIGELKEYYRNGNLKVRQYYKNDTLNDSAFFYHENGNIQYIQYLKNFKKEGTWKKFNEQGKLYEEINFRDDYLEGVSTKYTYRTGRLLQRLNYVSGMKEGKQQFFYNNGKPKAILYYHYDKPAMGTEEWDEQGEKINNDFKIFVREQNKLLLENKLLYFIKLENPKPDDMVFVLTDKDTENYATTVYPLTKVKDEFILEYKVGVGGFIMETIKIGAFRKTDMGNTVIETKAITVSANNF
jgi:antitoxin component YwqK of YwqJK toxin-antitoxin module